MKPLAPWSTRTPDFKGHSPSENTTSWLQENGSITARLRLDWPDLCVRVVLEGLFLPELDERERLSLGSTQLCWVREVQLHADDRPLVHARTVVPSWDHRNPWKVVSTLGQRPLGELLFALPRLQRSPLEFAWTRSCGPQGSQRMEATPSRRRVFQRRGAPLLLTEAFDFLGLPEPDVGPQKPSEAPMPR